MTPQDAAPIPLDALSERELLIICVTKLNSLSVSYRSMEDTVFGTPTTAGIKAQVGWLWLVAGGAWALMLVALTAAFSYLPIVPLH
jgi:hypothetical protein